MHLLLDFTKHLQEYDLTVRVDTSASRIGILGASGCGKSMTLKSIAGIVRPDAGKICVDGDVFFDSGKKLCVRPQKRNVGYLFQNYALFPTMTVEENVLAGLENVPKKERRERCAAMIARFHLAGLEKRYPGELSGGQQQRVALARLLAGAPKMIFLDEPFSAMDAYLKDQLQEQLFEMLQQYDGTMILVSHNRDEIYRFCEDLLVMDRGRIIREGKTKDVFANPKVKQASILTGCKNYTDLVRIDAHHAHLVDYGVDIETKGEIPEGTTCLGYRAHDFIPVWEAEEPVNAFPVREKSRAALPFEENFYLVPQGDHREHNPEHICWFVQRSEYPELETKGLPRYLQMAEEKMLFLTDPGD